MYSLVISLVSITCKHYSSFVIKDKINYYNIVNNSSNHIIYNIYMIWVLCCHGQLVIFVQNMFGSHQDRLICHWNVLNFHRPFSIWKFVLSISFFTGSYKRYVYRVYTWFVETYVIGHTYQLFHLTRVNCIYQHRSVFTNSHTSHIFVFWSFIRKYNK